MLTVKSNLNLGEKPHTVAGLIITEQNVKKRKKTMIVFGKPNVIPTIFFIIQL